MNSENSKISSNKKNKLKKNKYLHILEKDDKYYIDLFEEFENDNYTKNYFKNKNQFCYDPILDSKKFSINDFLANDQTIKENIKFMENLLFTSNFYIF